MFVQQLAGFFFVGAFLDGDQTLFGRHHIAYGGFQTVFKAHVTGSHDADQVAILQDRNAGDVVLAGQFEQFTDGGIRFDRDGLFDHTGFETLDLADFVSLLLDGHVLVDDTDTAFLSHGDCQTGFSYGVHCGGNQRNIQFNATGQTSLEADFVRENLGITGDEKDVIECECFLADTQHRWGSRAGKWKRAIVLKTPVRLNGNL